MLTPSTIIQSIRLDLTVIGPELRQITVLLMICLIGVFFLVAQTYGD